MFKTVKDIFSSSLLQVQSPCMADLSSVSCCLSALLATIISISINGYIMCDVTEFEEVVGLLIHNEHLWACSWTLSSFVVSACCVCGCLSRGLQESVDGGLWKPGSIQASKEENLKLH